MNKEFVFLGYRPQKANKETVLMNNLDGKYFSTYPFSTALLAYLMKQTDAGKSGMKTSFVRAVPASSWLIYW